jgi:predicted nucleotide-binding protein
MTLPIRTTLHDIDAVCGYLATKPTGATTAEAKAVLDKKRLDGRKLNALKYWGLIEENGGRMKLTALGRQADRDKGAYRSGALNEVIRSVAPYTAAVERAVHTGASTVTATEVAAHWHEHFKDEASDSDRILSDQAICFFQVAQGADLGQLTIGRRGQPTRFEFDSNVAQAFVDGRAPLSHGPQTGSSDAGAQEMENLEPNKKVDGIKLEIVTTPESTVQRGNRVFITHGKNQKIRDQMKELVAFGKFEPVLAQEHETAAKPVPEKVMDDMRTCQAAVIHVGSEGVLYDKDGNEYPQINGNVLIEIGACMALYGKNFVLLVEEGVKLPSNLQGLYECRYQGNELNMPAAMKILKAFNEFR